MKLIIILIDQYTSYEAYDRYAGYSQATLSQSGLLTCFTRFLGVDLFCRRHLIAEGKGISRINEDIHAKN